MGTIDLVLEDEEFNRIAKAAHQTDKTLNQFVNDAVMTELMSRYLAGMDQVADTLDLPEDDRSLEAIVGQIKYLIYSLDNAKVERRNVQTDTTLLETVQKRYDDVRQMMVKMSLLVDDFLNPEDGSKMSRKTFRKLWYRI